MDSHLKARTLRPMILRAMAVATAAAVVAVLAACTEPGDDEITHDPATNQSSNASPSASEGFASEFPDDICPGADVIPEDLAAPDDIGYTTEFGYRTNGEYPYQKCGYSFNDALDVLDGAQAVQNLEVQFYVNDDSSFDLLHAGSFSKVDFEENEAAEYFRDWDDPRYDSDLDLNSTWGHELEESRYISFQFFASVENLHVFASLTLVMPEGNASADIYGYAVSVNEAAYRVIEAVVASVVDELERT